MSLPYSEIVPTTAVVESPTFATEKKHMLLAVTSSLMPSTTPYLEFSGSSAVSDFGAYFGKDGKEYKQVQKYFSFLSKSGNAPEKLVVARWFREDTAAFLKGSALEPTEVTSIIAISDGTFKIFIDGVEQEVTMDFTTIVSEDPTYSEVAEVIQTALRSAFGNEFITCVYSSVTQGMIITSGTAGQSSSISVATEGTSGTDVSGELGLAWGTASQGVFSESYAEFCDRILKANTSGYSITTLETLGDSEIISAVEWLQRVIGDQNYNTVVRLVFNMNNLESAEYLQSQLYVYGNTGFVVCYDPYKEYINVLDCAICATIDYSVENGAINFNFQPADGYTPITTLGTVIDYKQGLTNSALITRLNMSSISCVYSLGFGSQTQNLYGFGLMNGDFGTEDVQVNESALEQSIQLSIINALVSLNKVKLRGSDAKTLVSSLLSTPLELFKTNGSIASDGTLTSAEKVAVVQATGNSSAVDSIEQNGYYILIRDLTDEDIANRRVRVLICYLAAGVVNKVRIINKIYGA